MKNLNYTEEEAKKIAWEAFISRTDEKEYFFIHRREAKADFEIWWNKNKKKK